MRYRLGLACLLCLALLGACAGRKPLPPTTAPPAAPVDAKAQQRTYDRGVALFSDEHYERARDARQETVRLGPDTALANQAKAGIAKVDAILKSLRDIDRQ